MKTRRFLSVLPLTLALFVSCGGGGKLTTKQAEGALGEWATKMKARCAIQGIQEFPEQNSAQVDFTVTDLTWQEQFIGLKHYTGPAVGTFSHYSDGRWVLTNIRLANELFVAWNTHIEAK